MQFEVAFKSCKRFSSQWLAGPRGKEVAGPALGASRVGLKMEQGHKGVFSESFNVAAS